MDAQELATMETKEDDSDEDFIPDKDDGSTTEEEGNEPEERNKDDADQMEPEDNEGVKIENDLATKGEGTDGGEQSVKEEGNMTEETAKEDGQDDKTHNYSKPQGGKGRKRKAGIKKEPKKPRAPKIVSLGKPKGKHSSLEERQLVIDMMLAG